MTHDTKTVVSLRLPTFEDGCGIPKKTSKRSKRGSEVELHLNVIIQF